MRRVAQISFGRKVWPTALVQASARPARSVPPVRSPSPSLSPPLTTTATARIQGPIWAALLAALALPWFVHAMAVLLSALGARPLSGRVVAVSVLAGAALVALALAGWATDPGPARSTSAPLRAWPRAITMALSATGALAFVLPLLLAVLLPVVAYDALAYRLPVIAQWLDAGRIAWVATDDPVRNGYPMGQEAVSAVIAAATGSMRWAGATSFSFVASGALAIWVVAEACGVRRELARAAAAVFVLAPMMILNAPSGYVDAAFAGASVALFCTAALLAQAARPEALLLAATGMAAAHVLALKGTGIAFVGLAALGVVGTRMWRFRGASEPRSVVSAARSVGAALAWAAPGAYWCARDLVHTGNPLWPIRVKVAGHTLLRGIGTLDQILDTAHNTPAAFVALGTAERVLRSWMQWSGPAVDFDDRMAGLGWAWPLLAVPAIALFASRRARGQQARAPIAFVLMLTAVCFALQPMSWWPRYTLWVWGGGALAMAAAAEHAAATGRQALLAVCLAAATALCVAEGAVAVTHAKDAKTAVLRWRERGTGNTGKLDDARHALNATSWISPEFWALGIERHSDVCRTEWTPKTDNANLDGVLAQLSPRPRVHVLRDKHRSWPSVRRAWQATGCTELLLLERSPVLGYATRDPGVSVERAVAFDPLFIVRPRTTIALGRFEDGLP
jgi:hypothetical protein